MFLLLDGSGRASAQTWPLQPQMSLQKCWFGETLISTKSPLEVSASSTAHQCDNTIPKNPTSGTILMAFTTNESINQTLQNYQQPHRQEQPYTNRLIGSSFETTTKIGSNCPKASFKTENTRVRGSPRLRGHQLRSPREKQVEDFWLRPFPRISKLLITPGIFNRCSAKNQRFL